MDIALRFYTLQTYYCAIVLLALQGQCHLIDQRQHGVMNINILFKLYM